MVDLCIKGTSSDDLLMSNKCKPEEREKLMGVIETDIFLISPKAAEPFARDVPHMLSERGHLDLLIQHMVIKWGWGSHRPHFFPVLLDGVFYAFFTPAHPY